jgi:hypothetical protein
VQARGSRPRPARDELAVGELRLPGERPLAPADLDTFQADPAEFDIDDPQLSGVEVDQPGDDLQLKY